MNKAPGGSLVYRDLYLALDLRVCRSLQGKKVSGSRPPCLTLQVQFFPSRLDRDKDSVVRKTCCVELVGIDTYGLP